MSFEGASAAQLRLSYAQQQNASKESFAGTAAAGGRCAQSTTEHESLTTAMAGSDPLQERHQPDPTVKTTPRDCAPTAQESAGPGEPCLPETDFSGYLPVGAKTQARGATYRSTLIAPKADQEPRKRARWHRRV